MHEETGLVIQMNFLCEEHTQEMMGHPLAKKKPFHVKALSPS